MEQEIIVAGVSIFNPTTGSVQGARPQEGMVRS